MLRSRTSFNRLRGILYCHLVCVLAKLHKQRLFVPLGQSIAEAQAKLAAYHEDTARADLFLALAQKYTDFSVLTTPMIHEFIDKIVVHAATRENGDREQEVEIFMKYIGNFDVPVPDPTPEELAEQERKRTQRAYYREKSRKAAAKKKAAQSV